MRNTFDIIVKTFKGLEEILAKELIELGADEVQLGRRAVQCKVDKALMYKANLHLRTASRLLKPIGTFTANNPDEVYEQVKLIDWEAYMDNSCTFAIDSTIYSETFTHSKFVAYRVKDAIADIFTEKTGKRPSVSVSNPDIRINIHIAQNTCTISLDSSGESLHKRGYRSAQNEAPINEALAAGMLLIAGWNGKENFVDPMCGSGTILIEAAMIALNIPPGIFRKEFAFERWKDFDKELFQEIYNDDSYERDYDFKVYGFDLSARAISIADENIKNAGLSKYIVLEKRDVKDFEMPEGKYLMVTNPPYGERMVSEDLFDIYGNLGRALKHKFAGNKAWVISSDEKCLTRIGMRPSKKYNLLNGELECSFCLYEVFEGKRNEFLENKNKR